MYRHKKFYDVKYTDADAYDNLKPSALLSFMEESACLSADELGFGYEDIKYKNLGFIISNWYFDFEKPVKLGDKLEIHTWPLKTGKIIFLRDFELFVKGEKVGVASSRWYMVDTETFEIKPTSAFFADGFFDGYNTERSVDFKAWKLPVLENAMPVYSRTVRYSDYDHYFHANNTKYADYVMDVISVEEFKDKHLKSFQITYVKQCKFGDKVDFYREARDGAILVEGRCCGELRVQAKLVIE